MKCERCKNKKADIKDNGGLLCARCYLDKLKRSGVYYEQRHKTFGRL